MSPQSRRDGQGSTSMETENMHRDSDRGSITTSESSTSTDERGSDEVDSAGEEEMRELAAESHYEIRKNAVHAIMNVPLMTANISQLRSTVTFGPKENSFYHCVLGLIISSLCLQVIFFFIIIFLNAREHVLEQRRAQLVHNRRRRIITGPLSRKQVELPPAGKGRQPRNSSGALEAMSMETVAMNASGSTDFTTNLMNYISLTVVFLITIINMLILGLGNTREYDDRPE